MYKEYDYVKCNDGKDIVQKDIVIDGNVNILIHKNNTNLIFESNEPFLCFIVDNTYRIESGIEPIVLFGGCICIIKSVFIRNTKSKYKEGSKKKFEFPVNQIFRKITTHNHAKVSFGKNTLYNNIELKSETHSKIYIYKTNFNKVHAFTYTHSKIEFNNSIIHDLTVYSKIHSSVNNFSAVTCTADADTHSVILFSPIITGKYASLKSCNHSTIYLRNSCYSKIDAYANTHSTIDFGKSEISTLSVDSLSFSTVSNFHAVISCTIRANIHSKIRSATLSSSCRYSEKIGSFSSVNDHTY